MGNRLNILLLTRYFPPEIGTAANLFFELAKGLTFNGHQVTVVTNFPWYNLEAIPEKYNKRVFMREKIEGFEVIRLKFPVFGTKKIKLIMGHLTVPFTTLIGGLIARNPDIIFVYSPPLFMGLTGWLLSLQKKVPWIMSVQDLHPQCYIDQGALKNRLVIALLETIEKFCYRKSSLITVHSEGNKDHMVSKKGIGENKVRVLQNWIDINEMQPLPRDNDFSRQHHLNKKFVVGYAGTLGMSQGLMSVIEAAHILRDRKEIEFFIVGDGIEKPKMLQQVKEYGLTNVRFLPMQPKSLYPLVVASSDVGLVTLNKKVKTPVVPSKIISIMAAGRPVLASMPLDGDGPKVIEEAHGGICIEAEDPEKLAGKIIFLAEHKEVGEQLGSQGRDYVVKFLSLKRAVSEIEHIFRESITNHLSGGSRERRIQKMV
ncbi:MAG: glycosyltransferase family 4 protein [Pseudomonadota bacterium]